MVMIFLFLEPGENWAASSGLNSRKEEVVMNEGFQR